MKKVMLICAPVTSRSGYGDHARDLVLSFKLFSLRAFCGHSPQRTSRILISYLSESIKDQTKSLAWAP